MLEMPAMSQGMSKQNHFYTNQYWKFKLLLASYMKLIQKIAIKWYHKVIEY